MVAVSHEHRYSYWSCFGRSLSRIRVVISPVAERHTRVAVSSRQGAEDQARGVCVCVCEKEAEGKA